MGKAGRAALAGAVCVVGCSSHSGALVVESNDAAAALEDAATTQGEPPPSMDDAAALSFGSGDAGQAYAGCQPGHYAGTYTGTFQTLVPVTGPVTIDLTPQVQQAGEIALVTNGGTFEESWGLMAGDASAPIVVTNATLMGQLDCTSGMFEATAPNAMFTIAGVPSGMSMLDFGGTYDAATATISGSFTTTSMLGDSMGTWQVTRVP